MIPCNGNYQPPNVDWLICQIKQALSEFEGVKVTLQEIEDYIKNLDTDLTEKINETVDKAVQEALNDDAFLNENLIPKLEDWIIENMTDIVGETIKQVYFGLSDDGYFVAYIPSSWEDITFSTCVTEDCYGRLILQY